MSQLSWWRRLLGIKPSSQKDETNAASASSSTEPSLPLPNLAAEASSPNEQHAAPLGAHAQHKKPTSAHASSQALAPTQEQEQEHAASKGHAQALPQEHEAQGQRVVEAQSQQQGQGHAQGQSKTAHAQSHAHNTPPRANQSQSVATHALADEDDEQLNAQAQAAAEHFGQKTTRKRFGPEFLPVNLSSLFVRHPVATTLLTIALALSGAVAFKMLPVAPLPEMDFPVIFVRASLPGAGPETMATTVATPLERAVGRISGITELTSRSSQGSTSVIIQFDLERDINGAARDVQAAINAARSTLPTMPSNPSYRKVNPAGMPILILALTSETISNYQMYDMANNVLAQKILQTPGVGEVNIGGGARSGIRVKVNPDALYRNGLTMADLQRAIRQANVFMPCGMVDNSQHYWLVGINSQLDTPSDYGNLVLAENDGHIVRLKDVATIIEGPQDVHSMALFNNKPAVLLMIFKSQGANIIETVDRIKAMVPSMRQWVTEAVTLDITMDKSITIRASLLEVEKALLLSMALVILVVFLFLRNTRATSIPAVAAPVSLIATFGVMYILDYSLNNLSLMALTIATGFVVDDAIVVLENIVRRLERGETPLRAALNGSREVCFTIISMTLSLVAVFIPILLMPGILGSMFREFAVVLSVSVLISMAVSLTTTPMMCAYLLRSREEMSAELQRRLTCSSERSCAFLQNAWAALRYRWSHFMDCVLAAYTKSLAVVVRHKRITMLVFLLVLVGNGYLYVVIPKGFFPQQDTGMIMGGLRMDQSLSFQAGSEKLKRIQDIVRQDPAVDTVSSHYQGGRGSSGMFISLKPLSERKVNAQEVINRLRPKLMREPGVQVFLQAAQDLQMGGRSSRSQYQYTLQSDDLNELREWGRKLSAELSKSKIIKDVDNDLEEKGLETVLTVNRDLLARYGVTMADFDQALGLAYGQSQISTIYREQNQYKVVVGFDDPWWQAPEQLEKIRLPGTDGLVPLTSVATISSGFSSLSVSHQGQFAAVTISFNLAPGKALSDAERVIADAEVRIGMPNTVIGSFQGTAKLYSDTVKNELILIFTAILVLYIVLGILYESLIHPLTILSTLPPAGGGALIALMLCGAEFSVIALIGVLLLCGLVKKNAILMIDFALTAEREGKMKPTDAILTACRLRFRPIMMTTFAAMLGAVPLALGQGDGAEIRQPLGIAIVGGLAVSQLLTLYTTPVIFLCLDSMRHRFRYKRLKRRYGERKARLLLALSRANQN